MTDGDIFSIFWTLKRKCDHRKDVKKNYTFIVAKPHEEARRAKCWDTMSTNVNSFVERNILRDFMALEHDKPKNSTWEISKVLFSCINGGKYERFERNSMQAM